MKSITLYDHEVKFLEKQGSVTIWRLAKPSRNVVVLGENGCGLMWDKCPYGDPGEKR